MTAPTVAQVRAVSGVVYLLAAIVVLFAEVGLYVFMTQAGHASDFTGLGLLLTPIVLGLFVKAGVDSAAAPQNVALATIQHQTNGVLAAKIRDGVRDVLSERDTALAAAAVQAPSASITVGAPPSVQAPASTAEAIAAAQAAYYAPGTAPAIPAEDPPGAFAPEPAPSYDDVPAAQPFTD